MRIGLFTDTYTPDINGVVSSIVTLQKELEKNGHDVFVITNHRSLLAKREGNILRLPGMELKWLYGYKLSTPYHFSARDEIRDMHLDVIHVHTEFGVGMFGRIVAKTLNIPVVSTYHTMYEDYMHYINRFDIAEIEKVGKKFTGILSRNIGESVQAVIAPSEKTKETLIKYGVTTPIYIIPTGLDLAAFHRENLDMERVRSIKQEYHLSSQDKVIVYVGRIAQEKSIEIPLEGFRFIEDPHVKFMIVGSGPQLNDLKEQAKRCHLEDRVIFTDKKPREDVPYYYACADAFVSASLTETQGMTFIESMAGGLPLFARRDKVLEDLVIEDQTGYYFHDAREFAEKVTAFLRKDGDVIRDMGKAARDRVVRYDSDIFYNKVLSVYYQAIDDFQDAYEVLKIKTLDDYVKITVMNEKESSSFPVLISVEDYFLYKIRKGTMLDRNTVEEFHHKEKVLLAYRACIRRLRLKDYTHKEMHRYLEQKTDLSEQDITQLLNELEEKGYVNDQAYLHDKMEKLHGSMQGKGKILRSLVEKGIPYEDVKQALDAINDDDESQKAVDLAEKLKQSVKDKSQFMTRQTIMRKLIANGFDSNLARSVSEKVKLPDVDEKEALDKTIQKAMRMYGKKYKGYQLKNKVMVYCMNKGFSSNDIITYLNEMEWKDE